LCLLLPQDAMLFPINRLLVALSAGSSASARRGRPRRERRLVRRLLSSARR
jgi:hypothetical protein